MKVNIEEISMNEEEMVVIRCHEINEEVLRIVNSLRSADEMVIGYEENHIHRIPPKDVYYFESVDNKVFIYCKNKIFESRQKLYEIEEIYGEKYFLRTSKSVIMNIRKIQYVTPAYNGRFEACFDTGEKQIISRQYVAALKKKLMI